MRQEIGKLRHQVDAGLIVVQSDMHMHAAYQHAPRNTAKIMFEFTVALLVGEVLLVPVGKGMTGHGERRQTMIFGNAGDDGAQAGEIGASFRHGPAHGGADLYLALQEFRTYLAFQFLNAFGHQRFRSRREIESFAVYKQILLFDAEGKAGLTVAHGGI